MSKNYISPSMLPMKEISEFMEKVYGFGKKGEASADTNNVDGIKSSLIAKAATNENGELIADRDTVNNALSLGGIPANKYITSDGASTLLADSHQVSVTTGNEIKNLRDELYQMKAELLKTGIIKDASCYNGFIDNFKIGDEKYISEAITVVSTESSGLQINTISVEDTSDLIAGEYIVVNTTEPQIVKIQDVVNKNRIDLESTIAGPIVTGTEIFKTFGTYNQGAFVFGTNKEIAVSSKEKFIILNDDTQPLLLTKKYTANSGYAAQINIPSTAKGAIKKIGVQAKVTGFPGALKCYVIDPTSNDIDIATCTTIEEMKINNKVIGESNLIYPSQATQSFNELYFEFSNTIILDKTNYVFLFVQVDADVNNYWELKGLRGQTQIDLHTNNKLYNFSDGIGLKAEDGDLYLVVVTSDVLRDSLQYAKQGLYSCKTKLHSLTKATRARVELKVNREGRFKVIDNPNTLVPNKERALNTYNEDNKSYPTNLFNAGDKVAIGTFISEVGLNRTDNTSFNLTGEAYAPSGSDVYRIGYKVQAKAFKKVLDFTDHLNPIKIEDSVLVDLPLIAIVPGKEAGKEDLSSDRLIFEAELNLDSDTEYKLKEFDEIEIQVYWENKGVTNIDLNNSPEIAGKIFDITVSTDNTYNTIKK